MESKEPSESNTDSISGNNKTETSHSRNSDKNKIIIDFKNRREGVNKIIGIINQKIIDKKYPMFKRKKSLKSKEKSSDSIMSISEDDKKREINELKSKLEYFREIEDIHRNPFTLYDELIKENMGNMDDEIFEKNSVNLLKKKYELVEYNEFPIFNRIISKKKNSEITQLSYIEISSKFAGEKPYYNFILKDANEFIPINYPENKSLFVLIELNKEKDTVNYLANIYLYKNDYIMTKMFQKSKKDKNSPYTLSIGQKEMDESYISLSKEIDIIDNDRLDDSKKPEEKAKLLIRKKDLEKKKECLLKEGNKNFLEISLELRTQECDGFLRANKNIWINSKNNSIPIPKESFIIVECKNNCKIDAIIQNIYLKKRKLELLGIKSEKLFFIGILYDINEQEETKFNNKNAELSKKNIFLIRWKDLVCNDEKFYENPKMEFTEIIKDLKQMKEKLKDIETIIEKINNIEGDLIFMKKIFSNFYSDYL